MTPNQNKVLLLEFSYCFGGSNFYANTTNHPLYLLALLFR